VKALMLEDSHWERTASSVREERILGALSCVGFEYS
jgi:hypothetical protein